MLADDLVYIFPGFAGIPGAFGVNDHTWAEFAAVETTGVIDAGGGDFEGFDAGFHIIAQAFGIFFSAAAARMAGFAAVGAAENVVLEETHYRL